MFEIFLGYVLFSLSVGITSYFTIYRPTFIKIRDELGIWTAEMEHSIIAAVVLILLASLTAPVMLKVALTGPTQELEDSIISSILDD